MEKTLLRYNEAITPASRWQLCNELMSQLRALICGQENVAEPLVDFRVFSHLSHSTTDCGAIVMLGFDNYTKRFVVIKEYIHEDGVWQLPLMVLRQLQSSCKILSYNNKLETRCLQKCLDVHISENATHFIFKYYCFTFDALFHKHRLPTPWDFTVEKTNELLTAVQLLHKTGVVHRDLKDANLCFDKHARLVLIDFDSSASEQVWARYTLPACSLLTRAPEQMQLELAIAAKRLQTPSYDARAGDWWAAGCIIAQMFLNGTSLFKIRGPNWILSEVLEDIKEFAKELQCPQLTAHAQVKALYRCVSPNIFALLCGLLNLDPVKREPAARSYLLSLVPAPVT